MKCETTTGVAIGMGGSTTTGSAITYYPLTQPHPCPTCGHCPTCGRGGIQAVPYPIYPQYPVDPTYQPWYVPSQTWC